jgi:hypothetical protein
MIKRRWWLTICHEGNNVLTVEWPVVDHSPTRQAYCNLPANSLFRLQLFNLGQCVVIVPALGDDLIHDNLGCHPNLSANAQRKLHNALCMCVMSLPCSLLTSGIEVSEWCGKRPGQECYSMGSLQADVQSW